MRRLRQKAAWLRRRPLLLAAVALALVVVATMAPALLGGGWLVHSDIWTSDLNNHNVPLRAYLGRQLRAGDFPLWVPGLYTGLPLLAHGEAAAMSPLTWLLYGLLPYSPATNVSVALHTWLAGFGLVLLARRLGARTLAATVAGVSFMLCGFLVEHVKHMNLHHASAWLPWLGWAVDRLRVRPSSAGGLTLGALGALQLTEGHPQMAYVSLLVLLPLLGARTLADGPRLGRRSLCHLGRFILAGGLAVLVATALSGAYLLATLELAERSVRRLAPHIDPFTFATQFEFFPENIFTLFWAHIFGDGADGSYDPRHGLFWESWLYIGVVPSLGVLLAAGAALRRAFGGRGRLLGALTFWTLLCVLAFKLMLGKHSPLYVAAFDVVPGLSLFRFPQRFALVLELALPLIGAFGIDALLGSLRWLGQRPVLGVGLGVLVAASADMVHVMARHFPAAPGRFATTEPRAVEVMRQDGGPGPWRYAVAFAPEAHGEAFAAARAWRWPRPYVEHRELLQPDANLLWDVECVEGHGSLLPYDVGLVLTSQSIIGSVIGPRAFTARLAPCADGRDRGPQYSGRCTRMMHCSGRFAVAAGALGVRYLLSPIPTAACPGFELVAELPAGRFKVWIYRNEHWLPRAYLVEQAIDLATVEQAARWLMQPSFDPSAELVRVVASPAPTDLAAPEHDGPTAAARRRSPPRTERSPVGVCAYRRDGPNEATIRCRADRDGLLVVSDLRYPGLRARVDGHEVASFAANVVGTGLVLGAGDHVVRLAYRPPWRWLVPVAWAGWLGLLALGLSLAGRLRLR